MATYTKEGGVIDSEVSLLQRKDTGQLGNALSVRNDDGSVLSARVTGTNTLVQFQVLDPTLNNSAATKSYVDTGDASAIRLVQCTKDFADINAAGGGSAPYPWAGADFDFSFNPVTAGVNIPPNAVVVGARIHVPSVWNGSPGVTGTQVAIGTTTAAGAGAEDFAAFADSDLVISSGTFPKDWNIQHWNTNVAARNIHFNFKVLNGTRSGNALLNGEVTLVLQYVVAPQF
tara:strand:+ start:1465 stop:2154 length:690 start_codon:yes stop_codon:yes gene_type:complete